MARERYKTDEVFTPTTPARLTFVEREVVNNKAGQCLENPREANCCLWALRFR